MDMAIPKDIEGLIEEMSTDPKYRGECGSCGESFRLKDAGLFYFDNFTKEGVEAKKALSDETKEIQGRYQDLMQRIKKGAPRTSLAVNVGKICEKVAPAMTGFPHSIDDCRFMAEPIDYLIFSGLMLGGRVNRLIFMDIKTGNARLNKSQLVIKETVERGKVELLVYDKQVT